MPTAPDPLAAALTAEVFASKARHRVCGSAIADGSTPWLGVGLSSRTELGRGLPIDVLAMLTALETVRRALRAERSTVLVADSNAIAEGFARAPVHALARRVEETIGAVAEALEFPIALVRGSAVAPAEIVVREPTAAASSPAYVRHQLAQMRAMARAGATVKIGWRLVGHGTDESAFDRAYQARSDGPPMTFVYTIAGRGLDPQRPRACPYVAARPEERILLAGDERIGSKLARARQTAVREANGYTRLLGKIARTLARLSGRRVSRPPERDLQALIDRCGAALPSIAA